MSQPRIELISFNLCPFVQRSVITLEQKGIDYAITYIDLRNKPDWFIAISPLGKVPVVRYGDDVLFESAIINEFLDEVTPDSLMPASPLDKAKDRAWIEYSSQILMDQYQLTTASTQEDFARLTELLNAKLERLERQVSDKGFFNQGSLSLIDTAIAPLFTRFDIIARQFEHNFLENFPKLSALGGRLLALDAVKKSVLPNFEDIYIDYLKESKSVFTA